MATYDEAIARGVAALDAMMCNGDYRPVLAAVFMAAGLRGGVRDGGARVNLFAVNTAWACDAGFGERRALPGLLKTR
jgi:hypothetical protein